MAENTIDQMELALALETEFGLQEAPDQECNDVQ